jgi:membrane protein DedA with SNARE-associated domain
MLADFMAFVGAHPHLSYGAVFLLALSESIPIIGAIVPGTATILAICSLIPSGMVALWPLLIAATIGAVAGDGLSYWAGHRYHRAILERWPLVRFPQIIAKTEAFFRRHGDKSVFLARFTPGVRAFVPLGAGVMRMSAGRFYAANILSALAWGPSHVLAGAAIGTSIGLFGISAERMLLLLAGAACLLWAGTVLVRRLARRRTG